MVEGLANTARGHLLRNSEWFPEWVLPKTKFRKALCLEVKAKSLKSWEREGQGQGLELKEVSLVLWLVRQCVNIVKANTPLLILISRPSHNPGRMPYPFNASFQSHQALPTHQATFLSLFQCSRHLYTQKSLSWTWGQPLPTQITSSWSGLYTTTLFCCDSGGLCMW